MQTSVSITIMGSYTSENNCSGQWRHESTSHLYDINGLPDLASDGLPLFEEPMFLFEWALWVAWIMPCVGNFHYSIYFYKTFLRTHCFGYSELIFPLKASFPITLFRFLETNVCWNQSSYAMNVPLTFITFFAKVTTLFLKWKRTSLLSNSFRHWSLICSTTLHCCCCCAS